MFGFRSSGLVRGLRIPNKNRKHINIYKSAMFFPALSVRSNLVTCGFTNHSKRIRFPWSFAGGTYTLVLEEVCQHSTERRWNLGWWFGSHQWGRDSNLYCCSLGLWDVFFNVFPPWFCWIWLEKSELVDGSEDGVEWIIPLALESLDQRRQVSPKGCATSLGVMCERAPRGAACGLFWTSSDTHPRVVGGQCSPKWVLRKV